MSDSSNYVRKDEHGVFRVGETRVAFDSLAAAFDEGHSPEMIRQQYPSLSLEAVYGAITWYLAHSDEAREYLASQNRVWESAKATSDRQSSAVVERIRKLRENEAPRPQ